MEDYRVDELIEKFDKYMLSIENDELASKQFLQGAGIIDGNGNLEEPYKNLCTHQEQV